MYTRVYFFYEIYGISSMRLRVHVDLIQPLAAGNYKRCCRRLLLLLSSGTEPTCVERSRGNDNIRQRTSNTMMMMMVLWLRLLLMIFCVLR